MIFHRGDGDALSQSSDGFGDDADALLVFWRKKKRPQEWAMDTIAEGELRCAKSREKEIGEARRIAERGQERFAPDVRGLGRDRRRGSRAGHLPLAPA